MPRGVLFTVDLSPSLMRHTRRNPRCTAQVKKALEKGNKDGAMIYGQNAIRKKNEALNFLKASAPGLILSRPFLRASRKALLLPKHAWFRLWGSPGLPEQAGYLVSAPTRSV